MHTIKVGPSERAPTSLQDLDSTVPEQVLHVQNPKRGPPKRLKSVPDTHAAQVRKLTSLGYAKYAK
eukprot:1159441-Pelagomonas_calceolata.AAC.1